jgi:hypothetical protein
MSQHKLYLRENDGQYTLSRQDPAGMGGRQFEVVIVGPTEPPLPPSALDYHGFVLWQGKLIEQGFQLSAPSFRR